jgi:hypothetical protein
MTSLWLTDRADQPLAPSRLDTDARSADVAVVGAGLTGLMVIVTPVMLGDGTRQFEHPGGQTVRLEQLSVSHTKRVTNLWYRIVGSD